MWLFVVFTALVECVTTQPHSHNSHIATNGLPHYRSNQTLGEPR